MKYEFIPEPQQANVLLAMRKRSVKYALFLGGIGTGKSLTGAHYALDRVLNNPETVGMIGANDYPQLYEATLPAFTDLLDEIGLDYVVGKQPPKSWKMKSRFKRHSRVMSFTNGAQIILRSLERYNSIRGSQYGWAWCDETRDTKLAAWRVVQGRLREPNSKQLKILLTTSANGFDWIYDEFHVAPNDPDTPRNRDHVLFRMRTRDNRHNLPDGYEDSLRATYSPMFAAQELDAEFVSLSEGRTYYAFSEANISRCTFDPNAYTVVTFDFNTAAGKPFCCYVLQQRSPERWECVKEFAITGTHTREVCGFVDEYLNEKRFAGRLSISGDYAGSAHRSTSSFSDYQIIEQVLGHHNGFTKLIRPTRRIKDRTEALNAWLCNAQGVRCLLIDESCTILRRDLEQVTWSADGLKLNDKDPKLTHASDAVSYVPYNVSPVDFKRSSTHVRNG